MAKAALPAVEARSIELASLDDYPHASTHHTGEHPPECDCGSHDSRLFFRYRQFSVFEGRGALLGRKPASPTSGKIWWCIPAALILPHASEQLSPTIRTRLASSRPFAGFAECKITPDAQWQRGERPLNTTCSLVSSLSRCLDRTAPLQLSRPLSTL